MNKEAGRKLIAERVEDFEKNKPLIMKKSYGETNIRTNYIDVMFEALGWNIRNKYEVDREFSQRDKSTAGGTKKVDYAFKINGKLKFFIEAKEASVDLENDKSAIFQAKRYAYSSNGKAPIVILTDFEEFRVFNVIKAPLMDNTDRELLKTHTMRYTDYLEKWDLLWDTFSKEAVGNGSLDKLRGKIDKNTKTMDVDFLEQITSWREILAKNIAIRNENLNVDEINEAVQRILDRLVFIRNLEDREIEPENTLLDKTKKSENIYKSLIPIFNSLNTTYNGLLFKKHFSEEINVDDKTIHDIIRQMCYPVSPFQFDVIEPEILGRIYEKFLGSKIRLTDSHRAKIEEKIEVRKAGGVYYTPEYIVEYIVQNTVGKKIEGLTPEEIKKIKIVDPACGSGSFLIGAYSYLLDYHQKWYTENQKDKTYQADWYKTNDGEIKVRLDKRGDILRNNIFGVDIDKEATEVAIMSLYLKMLDDGFDKGERDLFFVKGSVLPDMIENIKCGNSLIDRDTLFANDMFGDKDIKPFDWEVEFKNIFIISGGFDCIIGNPPYVKTQILQEYNKKATKIYKNFYKSAISGNFDIYILFLEKSMSLLSQSGLIGFILPHKFFNSKYGVNIRKIISDNKCIKKIIHFGVNQIFDNATTYTCLLFLNNLRNDFFQYYEYKQIVSCLENTMSSIKFELIESDKVGTDDWLFGNSRNLVLLEKIKKGKPTLEHITTNIFQGPKAGADPVFIIKLLDRGDLQSKCYSNSIKAEFYIENDIIKSYVKGKNIKRYSIERNNEYIIYPYNKEGILFSENELEKRYPLAHQYLSEKENKKILIEREAGRFKKTWWSYSRPQNMRILDKFKILTPFNAFHNSFAYDDKGDFVFSAGVSGAYGILLKTEYNLSFHYLLGLLNSKLLQKFLMSISTALRGNFYSYENKYIKQLPIYTPDENDNTKYIVCKKIEEMVKMVINFKKNPKNNLDADYIERKIDELVYQLYELTEEEILVVEGVSKNE